MKQKEEIIRIAETVFTGKDLEIVKLMIENAFLAGTQEGK